VVTVALLAVVGVVLAVVLTSGGGAPHRRVPRPRAAPPRPASPPAPSAGEELGVNVNRLFNGGAYSAAQIDEQLQAVAATGVTVARSDALWETTEPAAPRGGEHHYDWRFDDTIAGSLAAHGLRWLPLLDYSAPWAQSIPGVDHSAPRSASDFAAFAAAVAARYGAGGSFWRAHAELRALPASAFEVWNEPDNPSFWRPSPNAGAYAALYLATREAIRGVDPKARVIVGGLSNVTSFLPQVVAAHPGLAGQVDGVAIHPYGDTPLVVAGRVRAARATLSRLGMGGVPLYVTEFGWTTHPAGALNYAPAARRGSYIEATTSLLGHTDCGLAAVLLYTWITPGADRSDPQDWYGLRVGGVDASPVVDQMADKMVDHPRSDVEAFAEGVRRAEAAAPAAAVCR
jgi:hypothetical protein